MMIKKFAFHIICLICIFIISCKNSNTPDQVAIKFLNAMYTYDFDMAKDMSTKNTWPIINGLKKSTSHITEEEKMELVGKLKIEIIEVKPETDSTELVYYKSEPDFQIFKAIKILKQIDEEGKTKYKIDNSSTDSLSGADDLQLNETIMPFSDEIIADSI